MFRRYRRGIPERNGGVTRGSFAERVARAQSREDIRWWNAGLRDERRELYYWPPPFSTISWKLSVATASAPRSPSFFRYFLADPSPPPFASLLSVFMDDILYNGYSGVLAFCISIAAEVRVYGGSEGRARSYRQEVGNRERSASIGLVSVINTSALGNADAARC